MTAIPIPTSAVTYLEQANHYLACPPRSLHSTSHLFAADEIRPAATEQLQIILSTESFVLVGGPALHVLHRPFLLAQAAQRRWLRRMVRLNIIRLPRTAASTHVAERFRDFSHMIVERIQTVSVTCSLSSSNTMVKLHGQPDRIILTPSRNRAYTRNAQEKAGRLCQTKMIQQSLPAI